MKTASIIFFASIVCQTLIANALNELPFIISVCAYNNAPWVEKNLDSIFMQCYSNFHVIYIDDASSDDTASKVQEYIHAHNLHEKCTLIINPIRCRKTKNIYNLFHTIPDDNIIIQVDGDDWLAHDQVFSHINTIYQEKDVWLTYGQFIFHPSGYKGSCQAVPQDIINGRSFRSWKWVYTHLRTFYAWLFKNIKLEDFINEEVPGFEGTFFPLCDDTLSYFPMLEMCGDKFFFIPDFLYMYNRDNPLLTSKIEGHLRTFASKEIRSRTKYPHVKEPIIHRLAQYALARADVIIISKDNPYGVNTLLKSLSENATGIDTIYVLYEQTDTGNTEYQSIQATYPYIQFINIHNDTVHKALVALLTQNSQEHVLLTKDTTVILETLNVHEYIIELERTQAYGFYFGFSHTSGPFYDPISGTNALPHEHIHDTIYAWKFRCAPQFLCNNFDMTLFKKDVLQKRLDTVSYSGDIDSFINAWQTIEHESPHNVGLFLEKIAIDRSTVKPRL